ncbi:MAG TPA: thaumatin family protein, partial [Polyangiaceae bacterium]|nr:thaumatin family protein [Polyangiaceae bacterium]
GGMGGAGMGGNTSAGSSSAGNANAGNTSAGAASIDCNQSGDGKTTLTFVNRCSKELTYSGSDIASGQLAPGAFACVDIGTATEAISSKRYWGFVGQDPGAEHHTLAEFTFNTDFNDFDWYNISHVDAHNLPMQIVPVGQPGCKTLTCAQDFLSGCPSVGQYKDGSGAVIACVSPERDNGESVVARYFEACDDAYAWSADDQKGSDPSPMRACAGEDWNIVFCPESP